MLTLAMRRERNDSCSEEYQGLFRQRSRDSDEFVDILQVQQLLLETNGGASTSSRARPARNSTQQRSYIDTLPPGAPYYYGSYGQHAGSSCNNMEDLVAMWFAGTSTAGLFNFLLLLCLRNENNCLCGKTEMLNIG